MLDNLKKRDCDIKIKLTPCGNYYLHIDMEIQGDCFRFLPSSAMGGQFGDFVSALYNLFCEADDGHSEWEFREYLTDENRVVHTVITCLQWDEEGEIIDIKMSRKFEYEIDYENDKVDIEFWRDGEILKKYTVNTKDFCYAVAKACTDVLKRYGFYGYRYSTRQDYFKLHQLLYIKAFALGAFGARRLESVDGELSKKTSFEKEIELLLFDM